MSAASLLLRLPPILILLLLTGSHAVQLFDLVGTTSAFFGFHTVRSFSDGTVLLTGTSGISFKQLGLHPIVSVPNPPARLTGTVLLARIHRANFTVIWATAITTMSGFPLGIAIDPANNVFVAGEGRSADKIAIIKHAPSGSRLWEVYHTSPRQDKSSPDPLYLLDNDFSESSILSLLPRSELLIPVKIDIPFLADIPIFLTFSARNGKFLRRKRIPFPPNEAEGNVASSTLAVSGPQACYAFSATNDFFDDTKRMYARCVHLKRKNAIVTRQIDSTEKAGKGFFSIKTADLETRPPGGRQPSFFTSYERVSYPTGRRKSVNELIVRRLASDTFEDVDWATGKKSASAKPITISLPRPHPNSNSHTTFVLSLKYLRKPQAVVLFLWTSTAFEKIKQETRKSGRIVIKGKPSAELKVQFWLFFLDKKRQLFTRLIEDEDDEVSYAEEIEFSRNNKCVYIYGQAPGRPFFVRNVSNPLVGSGKKDKSC